MKRKAYIISIVLLGLLFSQFSPVAIGQDKEVMVPLEEIKSSCYGKIDMSKAEFALPEVGEECVKEEWLEENKPEPKESKLPSDFPIEKLVEKEPSLADVVKVVDNPKELLSFMNGYFSIGSVKNRTTGGTTAYSPEKFLEVRLGDCKDWATFAAEVLQKNGYNAKKFSYSKNPADDGHVIAIWKGADGQYNHLSVLGEKAKIFWDIGKSKEDIVDFEIKRSKGLDKVFAYTSYKPSIMDNLKAIGPVIAKESLESVPHIKSIGQDKLKLTPKQDAPSYKHNYLEGRIVKKEKKSWNEYLITAAVQLEKTFKGPSPKYVLVDFVTNANTRYTKYLPAKEDEKKIDMEKVKPGDWGLIWIEEKVASLSENTILTALKMMI